MDILAGVGMLLSSNGCIFLIYPHFQHTRREQKVLQTMYSNARDDFFLISKDISTLLYLNAKQILITFS